ncbi:MAG: hypothetical protein L3K19_01795 [Thermoplasmata archaeon]|nr:hypothetical protein [Thermoplasmata archaeon]
MIRRELPGSPRFLLVGVVRGLPSEVPPLVGALNAFAPERVGVGLSSDEARGLEDHFGATETEPIVPLAPTEEAEIRGLSRFGEVQVPHPGFLGALDWGRVNQVPVEPLDTSDEGYATMFTDHISYLELVRRTLRERRLTKNPPAAANGDEYVMTWERTVGGGRESERFALARDGALASAALRLGVGRRTVAIVVDRERFERVSTLMAAPRPT